MVKCFDTTAFKTDWRPKNCVLFVVHLLSRKVCYHKWYVRSRAHRYRTQPKIAVNGPIRRLDVFHSILGKSIIDFYANEDQSNCLYFLCGIFHVSIPADYSHEIINKSWEIIWRVEENVIDGAHQTLVKLLGSFLWWCYPLIEPWRWHRFNRFGWIYWCFKAAEVWKA